MILFRSKGLQNRAQTYEKEKINPIFARTNKLTRVFILKNENLMYKIQANPSGTRSLNVSEENLQTIEKYALFRHLIDSNGIVDETVLDKLKLNIRSLIAAQVEDSKDLLDLCIDVIYHNNMKSFGLQQLIKLYLQWMAEQPTEEEDNK